MTIRDNKGDGRKFQGHESPDAKTLVHSTRSTVDEMEAPKSSIRLAGRGKVSLQARHWVGDRKRERKRL